MGLAARRSKTTDKLAALARKSDSKTEALVQWIKKNLFVNGKLRDDERLLVFTEYKETLFMLGTAAPAGGLRQEHAAAPVRRHGPATISRR